jgi:hypothetical protein
LALEIAREYEWVSESQPGPEPTGCVSEQNIEQSFPTRVPQSVDRDSYRNWPKNWHLYKRKQAHVSL